MGVLSAFRGAAVRPADYRWAEADRIVSQNYGRLLLDSTQSKREAWHPDAHVRNVVRLMALTNKFAWSPDAEDLRPGDEHYLFAIDFARDDDITRNRHTAECLLLGGATNEEVDEYIGIPPEVVQLVHDIFFDVRDRLSRHLLIQDLFFGPAMMQGGAKGPIDTERVVAYLCGHQLFYHYRMGMVEEATGTVKQVYAKLQYGLAANQGLSAMLRRSFGYESTESVIEHLQQQVLLKARESAKAESENAGIIRIRNGVQALLSHNLKPQIADEGDPDFGKPEESVTSTADRVQEIIK